MRSQPRLPSRIVVVGLGRAGEIRNSVSCVLTKKLVRGFCHLSFHKHSRRVVVSYKQKYVHEVLVNCLFKLAQEKVWLGELTVLP